MLALRGVHKTFDDGTPVHAVRDVTFTLGPGEFAALRGPSGCGKTTLLALIAGLETADGGEIIVNGLTVTGAPEGSRLELRRHHVGLLSADHRLLWGLSLLDNVALAVTVAGAGRDAAEGRAHELLDLVGVGEGWRSLPAQVTPGERQRAALARALANRPSVLLADEPAGKLDSGGRRDLLDVLGRFHATGQSILLATHDDEVAAAASCVISMRDGCLDERDVPQLLTEPARHGRAAR